MKNFTTPTQKQWAIVGIGTSAFMISAEFYIVGAILPILMQQFHATFMTVQWVILIYTLMLTTMVLGVAKLGDIYDKKQLFLIGLGLFTISSFLCGLATNISILIAFRGLQGLGAVLIWALRNAMVTEMFPPEERGQALGWVTGLSSLGLAIGPGLGGLLISLWDWRFLFWINVPIGLAAGMMIAYFVPQGMSAGTEKQLDFMGLFLITITIGSFVLGATQLQNFSSMSPTVVMLLGLSMVGLLYFLYIESHIDYPILDLKLLIVPPLNINLLLFMMIYIIVGLIQLLFPLYLELGLKYSPDKAGFILTVLPLASVGISPLSGSLADRFGGRSIAFVGLGFLLIGCIAGSTLQLNSTAVGFCVRGILIELGLIMYVIPLSKIVMDAVQQAQLGVASGMLALSRMLGIVIGTSMFGLLFSVFSFSGSQLLSSLNNVSNSEIPTVSVDVTSLPVPNLVQATDAIFLIMALIILLAIVISTLNPISVPSPSTDSQSMHSSGSD
ncbi:MFS transporter [Anabaena sp. CS-542/02]|uniref:MFS transporter n=1 Tax=Anabaena sp. CS-542/02 TaxID=3021719 RepID=UPI00232DECE5|nr:MFS transporter [Anabaena sp. CS-542/02]MDB9446666.1 MFS transporter [Anabaena sp. CS-542/02]